MMQWNDYIKSLLDKKDILDSITIGNHGGLRGISKISKASILLLDELINGGSRKNIFVFPELSSIKYELLLGKVIHNIYDGRIEMDYSPYNFKKGQRLSYLGCIAEFDRIGGNKATNDNTERIWFHFCDNETRGVPLDQAPFFQIVSTKKLSSAKQYDLAKKKENCSDFVLKTLKDHKTHLGSSIFFISEINQTIEWIKSSTINGEPLSDVLYFQQCTGDGRTKNISSGQMKGIPAVIIASDLLSVDSFFKKTRNNPVQSIIVNLPQTADISKQLYSLDRLLERKIPIFCISDTANSFEDEKLINKKFWEWTWNKTTLPPLLDSNQNRTRPAALYNCLNQQINYVSISSDEASVAMRLMYKHKNEIEGSTPELASVYGKLFSLVFFCMQNILDSSLYDISYFQSLLQECRTVIEEESNFLTDEMYQDILSVISNLESYYSPQYINKKSEYICELLKQDKANKIALIVSDNTDKVVTEHFLNDFVTSNQLDKKIIITTVREYHDNPHSVDLIIVPGWFGEKQMRAIIYGFGARRMEILLYPCEKHWQCSHTKKWNKSTNADNNLNVFKVLFEERKIVDLSNFLSAPPTTISDSTVDEADELTDIEEIIQRNKYRKYSRNGNGGNSRDIVYAKPISFVGGAIEFCTGTHKVVDASDIILGKSEEIRQKTAAEVNPGDFLVLRESSKDMIKEIADKILEKEEKRNARELAGVWKDSLAFMSSYKSEKEIYEELKNNGCTCGFQTVKKWINDDEMIQPRSKDDLMAIAKAADDSVLLEQIDKVIIAGNDVDGAHKSAGGLLSKRLRGRISSVLKENGDIDILNVWDPITIDCEDIGIVKILKVIDVGTDVPVERGNTNRLLME